MAHLVGIGLRVTAQNAHVKRGVTNAAQKDEIGTRQQEAEDEQINQWWTNKDGARS